MNRAAAAIAIFFATAGGAAAKGPPLDRIDVCGRAACVSAAAGTDTEAVNSFFATGVIPAAPAAPQLYYEVWAVYADGTRELSAFFVRGASVLYRGDWNVLEVDCAAPLWDLTASLEPWPTPDVVAATIASKAVREPASYVRLFTAGRLTSGWRGFGGWLRAELAFDRSNPWAMTNLRISRKRGFVWRDGWIFRIPDALAGRARRGLSLQG